MQLITAPFQGVVGRRFHIRMDFSEAGREVQKQGEFLAGSGVFAREILPKLVCM